MPAQDHIPGYIVRPVGRMGSGCLCQAGAGADLEVVGPHAVVAAASPSTAHPRIGDIRIREEPRQVHDAERDLVREDLEFLLIEHESHREVVPFADRRDRLQAAVILLAVIDADVAPGSRVVGAAEEHGQSLGIEEGVGRGDPDVDTVLSLHRIHLHDEIVPQAVGDAPVAAAAAGLGHARLGAGPAAARPGRDAGKRVVVGVDRPCRLGPLRLRIAVAGLHSQTRDRHRIGSPRSVGDSPGIRAGEGVAVIEVGDQGRRANGNTRVFRLGTDRHQQQRSQHNGCRPNSHACPPREPRSSTDGLSPNTTHCDPAHALPVEFSPGLTCLPRECRGACRSTTSFPLSSPDRSWLWRR